MNIRELKRRIGRGERIVVEFTRDIEDFESCIDQGMLAVIIRVDNSDIYGCAKVHFDLNLFDSHNDRYARHNYYDENGSACLTAKEAGMYPKNGIETVYFDEGLDISEFIEIEGIPE